jgi:hypothetical protein
VAELRDGRAVLEFADGGRREIAAPEQIEITVGMRVRMIDTGDDAPIVAWGV